MRGEYTLEVMESEELARQQRVLDGVRAVVFDVGETLVDETRMWTELAVRAGVTPFALMGVIGALIEAGQPHHRAWHILGVDPPGGFSPIGVADFYPDALECVSATRASGRVVGIAGNQPAAAVAALQALGFGADFIASSQQWGVAKPSVEFFTRIVRTCGRQAHEILYVGDRLDNDILPAHAAGLRTGLLRRGPWGHIHCRRPEAATAGLLLDSLHHLHLLLSGDRD